jgi:hypothetical protein
MKRKLTTVLLGAAVAWFVPGCISSHTTVYEDAPPVKVEFENDTAARLFYEGLGKVASCENAESTTSFEIPVVLDVSRTRKVSYNVSFNRAVSRCDTNRDGRITEMEARIFLEHP